MKTKITFITLMMFVITGPGFAQESSRKAQRERIKLEQIQQTKMLVNSREFVFIAYRALPQRGGSIDLTTNPNYLKFHPDRIESYMPFFGRAYYADPGGEGGIKFDGKPKVFNLKTRRGGKGYELNTTVPGSRDNYQLNLSISPEGSATLMITSNDLSAISYYGEISKPEETKKEKIAVH